MKNKQSLKRRIFPAIFLIIFGLCIVVPVQAKSVLVKQDFHGKKVLLVNSYHQGYKWSDSISLSARAVLEPLGIEFREFFMDSKRHPDESSIKQAALRAQGEIERWLPDLVIVADDNASKYLVMPYYKDAELPFVFCGVNGDSTVYGYPYSNVTGIEEIPLIKPMPAELRRYARGVRLGVLSGSLLSDRRNVQYYKDNLEIHFDREVYVNTFTEWKECFLELQDQVDIMLFVYSQSVRNWDAEKAQAFVLKNTRIPCGATSTRMLPYALMVYAHVAEEHGTYAATTALRILGGEKPKDIPVKHKSQVKVWVNLEIAEKLGVVFPTSVLKNAEVYR